MKKPVRSQHHGSTVAFDVAAEAVSSLRARTRRSVLTAAGLATGVLALAATVGISSSLSAQVTTRFDALLATRVTLDGAVLADPDQAPTALRRLSGLNGVIAVGLVSASTGDTLLVSRSAATATSNDPRMPVYAMTPGALAAEQLSVVSGRLFDEGHTRRGDPVALLGESAARSLGIDIAEGPLTVTLAGRRLLVTGVVSAPPQLTTDLSSALIVPASAPSLLLPGVNFSAPTAVLRTARGAADQIALEAPLAADPRDPASVVAQVPPDPRQLRRGVEGDNAVLVLAMSAVTLLIAGVGVANTMYVSVIERRSEFGIRRSLGAHSWMLLGQVLLESCALGLAGGVLGTVLGTALTVAVSIVQGWPSVMPPLIYLVGPATGLLIGGLAGLLPASVAARVQPIEAIRD